MASRFGELVLDVTNSEGEYFPGDRINGKVAYTFFDLTKIKGIWVSLVGEEETNMLILNSGALTKANNKFLLKEKCVLSGSTNDQWRGTLRFTFELPKSIPGTYVSNDCWVKFFIRTTLILTPGIGKDYNIEKEIKVVSPINFNTIRNLSCMKPFSLSVEKEVGFLSCFTARTINMDVHFLKRAFVRGEQVKVIVDLQNSSNKDIKRIKLILGQTITTKASLQDNSPRRDEEEVLATSDLEGIPNFLHRPQKYVFTIEIPPSAEIPNFTSCKLFFRYCWIRITAYFGNSNVRMLVHIVLGHIPIRVQPVNNGATAGSYRQHRTRDESAVRSIASMPPQLPSESSASSFRHRARGSLQLNPSSQANQTNDLPPSYESVCQERTSNNSQVYPHASGLGRGSWSSNRPSSVAAPYPTDAQSPFGDFSIPTATTDLYPPPAQSPPYPPEPSTGPSAFYPMPLPDLSRGSLLDIPEHPDNSSPMPHTIATSPNSPPPSDTNSPTRNLPISCLLFMPGSTQAR